MKRVGPGATGVAVAGPAVMLAMLLRASVITAASPALFLAACGDAVGVCGDGRIEGAEVCDDGFTDACGSCNADCSGPGAGAACGDGERCPETEVCDRGQPGCGPCTADCSGIMLGPMCGDGIVCPDREVCDDGFADACGSCNADCSGEGGGSVCGDGELCPETEACDDGNAAGADLCDPTCSTACGFAGGGAAWGGHCYRVVSQDAGCAQGWLADVESGDENAMVASLVAEESWIGLTQVPGSAAPGEGWAWTGGTAPAWTGWAGGQPDDDGATPGLEDGEENRATIAPDGTWRDRPGQGSRPSVCEVCLDSDADGGCDDVDPTPYPRDCGAILDLGRSVGNGVYRIDPDGEGPLPPMDASCDMDTAGGGWTLVLSYLHRGGTNPALLVRTADLPLKGSDTLGRDESGTATWGHAGRNILAVLAPLAVRFEAKGVARRVIDFRTESPAAIAVFVSGTGSAASALLGVGGFVLHPGHTAYLPAATNAGFSDQGDYALTAFPFYASGERHWGIRGGGNRWEVDDFSGNASRNTLHRVWVRRNVCGDGHAQAPETCDDGNRADGDGCSRHCSLE